jgi:uncharacterized MAPEG superfamily protein
VDRRRYKKGNIVTTELEMLAWTSALTVIMWLPYILGHIKNVGLMPVLTYKDDAEPMPDWATRAKKAHYNAIENLAPFTALIVVAHLASISNTATATAAIAYFWFRCAHYILYILNVPFGRTLAMGGGLAAQIYIFYHIIMA